MILGWNWRVAPLLGVIAWAWLAGCGPKPKDLRVQPPQPMMQTQTMENDEAKKPMTGGDEDASADANAANATNADAAAISYLIHKVRWGHETLYSISLWYTGKGHYWERLAAENPEIQPRRMRVGDSIRIPEALLIRHLPMPVTFMNPATPHSPKKPSAPKQSPPSQESVDPAPLLYGPVEQAPPLYGPVGTDAPAPAKKHDELAVPLETLDK